MTDENIDVSDLTLDHEGSDLDNHPLVKEFEAVLERIDEKLEAAQKLIDEAVAISEATGVPFHASLIGARNDYIPSNNKAADPNLDADVIDALADLTQVGGEYYSVTDDGGGWAQSFC